MDIRTVIGKDYEDAMAQAKSLYGNNIGVSARREIVKHGVFGIVTSRQCEVTVFIPDEQAPKPEPKAEETKPEEAKSEDGMMKAFEQEAMTPDPHMSGEPAALIGTESEPEPPKETEKADKPVSESDERKAVLKEYLDKVTSILEANDFSQSHTEDIVKEIWDILSDAYPERPSDEQLEMLLADKIISSVPIDYEAQANPPRILVAMGPTGAGKTTTLAKIAAIYSKAVNDDIRRKVRIVTLDSFRVGAFEQMESFGRSLGIEVLRASGEEEFCKILSEESDADITLVDTMGKSPKDSELDKKLHSILDVAGEDSGRKAFLTLSASMKKADMDAAFDKFDSYGLSGVIVTKLDETSTVGNILSLCHERNVPLLFMTDGQRVPSDIRPATGRLVLALINGISPECLG